MSPMAKTLLLTLAFFATNCHKGQASRPTAVQLKLVFVEMAAKTVLLKIDKDNLYQGKLPSVSRSDGITLETSVVAGLGSHKYTLNFDNKAFEGSLNITENTNFIVVNTDYQPYVVSSSDEILLLD